MNAMRTQTRVESTQRRRKSSRLATALMLISLGLASGCSTPQAALDQANATAGLVTRFDGELASYRKAAAAVAEARLASIRRQEELMARLDQTDAWNQRVARMAGLGQAQQRRDSLIELAESRQADEDAARERLAAMNAQLAAVAKPLPSTSATLAALKKALADLGTELHASDRLKLALDALGTVRDEVKKNSDAAQSATANTAAAPVPTAPVTNKLKDEQP